MIILNFKSLVILPLLLGSMISISACTEEEAVESSTPEASAPADVAANEDVPTEAEDVVTVAEYTFTNTGEEEICELYLSPVDETQWGPDQLGENTIPAGEQYILQNIPAGEYDVQAVGCEGGEVITTLDIQP
jgi:hypothetical protein